MNLPALDLDMIKLTAQYVAKNGKSFLIQLTEMEKNNKQYDFLKPGHDHFNFFTKSVEAYKKCFNLSKKQVKKLNIYFKDSMGIMRMVNNRYEYASMMRKAEK